MNVTAEFDLQKHLHDLISVSYRGSARAAFSLGAHRPLAPDVARPGDCLAPLPTSASHGDSGSVDHPVAGRSIFASYLRLGSLNLLMADLRNCCNGFRPDIPARMTTVSFAPCSVD
ncbi:MAG: hypothetical protein ACXW3X_10535 [Rhodoplanes sp.]